MQLQFKITSEMIAFSVCLPRLTDPVPSCCSLSTAPASTSLKQPTFYIIKIRNYLLQLQIKFNSEKWLLSQCCYPGCNPCLIHRLSDPILAAAPPHRQRCLVRWKMMSDSVHFLSINLQSCGNETFLCGDIELNTYFGIEFAVTFEKILPWWVSKLRNVGKIPQQLSHTLYIWITFPLRWML